MTDYVIVANGQFLIREVLEEIARDKIIIALDGAANKLRRIHIRPHIILGDFDSITPESQAHWGIQQTFHEMTEQSLPYPGNHGVLIVPAKDQENTDLVKAIRYCDQQQATRIAIVCAAGGRDDHYEGVKMALRSEYKKNRPIIVHTEQQALCFARDEVITITGQVGDHCGVIATHTGQCWSDGLVYECSGHSDSICNLLKRSTATLTIKGDALVIMPTQLKMQRDFLAKSETERLKIQLRDAGSSYKAGHSLFKYGLFAIGAIGAAVLVGVTATYNATPQLK